jgi:thiamine-phosphate pyrophosphorylase
LTPERRAELRARLAGLHVLADDGARWKWDPVELARAACAAGAAVVQLRAKRAGDREALCWAERIRELTRAAGALFVVNDRFDLALLARADGVHLGQEDLPPQRLPEAARASLLVGRSTHTLEQARRALAEAVDYVAFGPVFGTRTKESPWEPRGTQALAGVVALAAPLPVVAIGGVHAGNLLEVARAGAGAAVVSAVAAAVDPEAAARELLGLLGERARP